MLKPTEALQLIGKGNLNWSEDEGRYVLLSFEETKEIVNRCVDAGLETTEDIMKIVRLYEDSIALNILFRNFLNNDITVKVEDGQVLWTKK